MRKRDEKNHIRRTRGFCMFFFLCVAVLLLIVGCASQFKKMEQASRVLPTFPYVAGAKAYFHAAHTEMILLLAKAYGIENRVLIENIDSIAASLTDSGTVVFVRTKPSVNISRFSKRMRLMKHLRATALDEDALNWRIDRAGKAYIVNIAYADALVLSDSVDVHIFQNLEFVHQLPKALNVLEVDDDYALWLWVKMNMFDDTFLAQKQKIRDGYGTVAIPEYNIGEDVSTDFAFPYDGVRSDFATLKLMLPFLFKSLGAHILSSLPDISFSQNMVMIRGVHLPIKTVRTLARIITSEEKKSNP